MKLRVLFLFSSVFINVIVMVVGKMYKFAISPVSLAGQEIKWCNQAKYLGIWRGVELLNLM